MDFVEDAIYEAAESPTVANNPKWQILRKFLLTQEGVTVDVLKTKEPKYWIDQLSEAMETLKAVGVEGEQVNMKKQQKKTSQKAAQNRLDKMERGRSLESRRESDDSGYVSDTLRKELNGRPDAVAFLVTNHAVYIDGQAILYCKYDDDDDQNYIAPIALKRLNVSEGPDGKVTLFFIDGDQSLDRNFIVQDCTVQGERLESDILFGMKTAVESNPEESPLEEISNKAFDGSDDLGDLRKISQTHDALTHRRALRPLQDDQAKALGYATGIAVASVSHSDDDPRTLGHKVGMAMGAALESFPR